MGGVGRGERAKLPEGARIRRPILEAAIDHGLAAMLMTLQQAFSLAFAREREGRSADARAIYEQILAAHAGHPGALLKIAEHELRDGALESARQRLETAVANAAAQGLPAGEIWQLLARTHVARGDRHAARHACEEALARAPNSLPTLRLLARLLVDAGDLSTARETCNRGLEVYPEDVELLHHLGRALRAMGLSSAARDALARCVAVAGERFDVELTLSAVCIELGLAEEAVGHLRRVHSAGGASAASWDNLGLALRLLGDLNQAARAFERAVELDSALTPALANLVHTRRHLCDWDGLGPYEKELAATLDQPGSDPRWSPHIALSASLSPLQQLTVARRWSRAMLPTPMSAPRPNPRSGRLRIGYLSSDLRDHATGRLMAGLFEQHDRDRFDIFAYSYGPDDGSELRTRIRRTFGSSWRDVTSASDADAAAIIRNDRIDLLIDRKGHTRGGRLAILASRPAPVQVHYMSFPGTLGYDAIDGLVADDEVIPPGDEIFYHERVWRMPRCYFVTDGSRKLPPPASRHEAGLPDGALILACFNQSYKLSAPVFATWMEALRRVPGAVLWLLAAGEHAGANLRAHAFRAGVDPSRLLFAPPVPQQAHLARLQCADLALDTLPVGSHTTACDALWAGVPMLTCRGATFAGRVGASILRAVGLPELVTSTLDEYGARLLELASSPERLREYRKFLERTRLHSELFDTAGFARDWEKLLERIYEETIAAR